MPRRPSLAPLLFLLGLALAPPGRAAPGGSVEKNHVILTNLEESDAYHGAVKEFMKIHRDAKVLTFSGRDVKGIAGKLKGLEPRFVTVVLKPGDLDFNFQASMLELCTGLDDDPFCDFSFGYVTGSTADEAVAFVNNIARAWKEGLPKKILSSPVSSMTERRESTAAPSFGLNWPMVTLPYAAIPHGQEPDPEAIRRRFKEHLQDYAGNGILYIGGHGSPEGIHCGISGEDLRALKPDLSPAVAYNYACFTGCVSRAFHWTRSREEFFKPVKARAVERGKSMALAILASGVSAYIASLEPRPAGGGMHAELKYALLSGRTLGEVRRREYDMLALGFMTWGEKGLKLRHYKEGDTRRLGNSGVRHMMMRDAGGAVLYGDPSFRIGPKVRDVFTVNLREEGKSLRLESRLNERDYCSSVDIYRQWAGRNMASRFYVEAELPEGRKVRSVAVESLTGQNGQPVEHKDLTWAISRTGDRSRIHVKLCAPPRSIEYAGSKVVFLLDPETGGKPAGPLEKTSGDGTPPPRREPARPAGSSATLASLLDEPMAFPRQEMAFGIFVGWVKAVLENKMARGGGAGSLRFAFDDAVKEAAGKTVAVAAMNDPLRKVLDGACATLGIGYVLEESSRTIRFTTREKAREGPAKAPPPSRPAPESGGSGGGGAEPPWRPGPVAQTPESAERLRALLRELEATPESATSMARYNLLQRIGALRTREALAALLKIHDGKGNAGTRSQAVMAACRIDCAETARALFRRLAGEEDELLRKTLRRCFQMLGSREAAVALVESGLKHRNPSVREASAVALGTLRWEWAVEGLVKGTKDRTLEVKLAAVEALGRLAFPAAIDALLAIAAEGKGPGAVTALWALGITGSRDPRITETAVTLLEGGKPVSVRVQAATLLGATGAGGSVKALLPLLGHKEWRLRAAAIAALAKLRPKEAVLPLIERLEKEKGRLTDDVARALFRITGIDIGYDAKLWRDWWAKNEDTFEPPGEVAAKEAGGKKHTVATYHRIPVVSRRIVFILDVSASMATKLEASARRTGPDGAPEGDTRLDYCKWELKRVIQKLAREVRFNIVTFESRVHPWQKGIVPSLPANKAAARDFVDKQRPLGGTGLGGALKQAFRNGQADTFYVLSDGGPTDMSTEEILRWVSRTNGPRKVQIHTISVGELATSDFLKRMAGENGGKHVVLK